MFMYLAKGSLGIACCVTHLFVRIVFQQVALFFRTYLIGRL